MTTIRLHATGAVETFNYTDDPGFFGDPTIVGAAPQWDDNSDATWARSQTDVDSTDWRAAWTRLDPLPGTYTQPDIVSITLHVRYDTAHPDGETSRAYTIALWDHANRTSADDPRYINNTNNPDIPDPVDDDGIHEADWVIYSAPSFTWDITDVLAALHVGAWLRPATLLRVPWQRSALTVYEAWIDVEVAGSPVVRQLHRRDGLGQASVSRLGAGTRSVTRVIGGPP